MREVGLEGAGADAEHGAATRQVIEHDQARSATMKGWCSGRSTTPVPNLMLLRALGRGGDEDRRVGEDLDGAAVVLADPGFVEVEAVEVLDELEVLGHCERWGSRSGGGAEAP